MTHLPAKQWFALCTAPDGTTFEYESLAILTLTEEDGELKLLGYKEFTDPEKRRNFHKILSEKLHIE